jgi:hypothetical protein
VIALDEAKKNECGQAGAENDAFVHNGKELYMIRLILVGSINPINNFYTNVDSESPVTRILKLEQWIESL